jgi:hypothetical protein
MFDLDAWRKDSMIPRREFEILDAEDGEAMMIAVYGGNDAHVGSFLRHLLSLSNPCLFVVFAWGHLVISLSVSYVPLHRCWVVTLESHALEA